MFTVVATAKILCNDWLRMSAVIKSVEDCWMSWSWVLFLNIVRGLICASHARRSLSTVGGHSGQSPPPNYCPPLIHLHFPPPLRNGVKSHSRCGTESWTELELAFQVLWTSWLDYRVSPQSKYWGGTCPPCPIGIDAPGASSVRYSIAAFTLEAVRCTGSSCHSGSMLHICEVYLMLQKYQIDTHALKTCFFFMMIMNVSVKAYKPSIPPE